MRRFIGAILLVVGAAVFVLGIGSATWWKPPSEVTATAAPSSQVGVIATEPGVLELLDDEVEVEASAPGKVEMVVASTEVARLWLGQGDYVSVTGLKDWTTLATTEPSGGEAPESLQLEGSDLFFPENYFSGTDAVRVPLIVPKGDFTLIAVGDGVTPDLTLTWHRKVLVPWTMPLIIGGLVTLAAGTALFMYDNQARRIRRRGQDRSDMWVDDIQLPADRAEATGRAYGAAIIPASPRAKELRGRELAEEDRIIIFDDAEDAVDEATESGESPEDSDERAEATGRAYGAAIIPASPRAKELRGRELAEEDRIILPAPPVPREETIDEEALAAIAAERAESSGRAYGAGIIPASPRAKELRGRELAEEDRIIVGLPIQLDAETERAEDRPAADDDCVEDGAQAQRDEVCSQEAADEGEANEPLTEDLAVDEADREDSIVAEPIAEETDLEETDLEEPAPEENPAEDEDQGEPVESAETWAPAESDEGSAQGVEPDEQETTERDERPEGAVQLPPAEEVRLDDTPAQPAEGKVRAGYNWRKLWGFRSKEEE